MKTNEIMAMMQRAWDTESEQIFDAYRMGIASLIEELVAERDDLLAKLEQAEPVPEPACPVCQRLPDFSFDARVGKWSGYCKNCGVEGSARATKEQAIKAWAGWHNKPSAQPVREPLTDMELRRVADCMVAVLENRRGVLSIDLEDELIEEIMEELVDVLRHGITKD